MLLRTLGDVRLDGAAHGLAGRKRDLALLAYLARKAPRPVPRAELADLLWEDRDEERAKHSLRQSLFTLRRAVGEGLIAGPDQARLDPGAVRLDAAEFEAAIVAGRLEEAVGWWEGDFLAGLEEIGGEALRVWLEVEREALRRSLGFALDRLSAAAAAAEKWETAVGWAERWSRFLPGDERGHVCLIETLFLAGRVAEARARYDGLTTRLRTGQEREPSAELRALGQRIERELSRPHPAHRPGSAALFTPDLIGRAGALAELRAGWVTALGGERTVVLVEGETGVGKTRLVEEFIRQVEPESRPVLACISARAAGAAGDGVAAALLERLASAPGLAAASPATLATIAGHVPAVRERFSSLPGGAGGGRLEAAAAEALSVVAEDRPVLLFLDDAEWADGDGLGSIAGIARAAAGRVLVIIAIGEHERSTAAVAALTGGIKARRIKLAPLTAAEVDALLASMLVLPAAERRALAARLHEEGGGNPLYTVELTAALVDEGVLAVEERGAWTLHPERWSAPQSLGLRATIERRTAGLGDDARAVAEAVAGLEPPAQEDAARAATGLPAQRFDAGRDELIARRLLRAAAPPASGYQFHHQAVRRAILEAARLRRDAPARRRRRILLAGAACLAVAALLPAMRRLTARLPVETADARQVLVAPPEVRSTSAADSASARALQRDLERALSTRSPSTPVVQGTLARMRRSDTLALPDRPTAREVAIRAGVRLLLVPSLTRTDGRLVVGYRIENTSSGAVIRAEERESAAALASTVERDVSAAAGGVPPLEPLPQVTTASLDALKAYASGSKWIRTGNAGRDMLRRAIALDSVFPSAQAMLAYFAWFEYDQRTAERHATVAVRDLDGLPPWERLRARLDAANAREDWPTAIDCARELIELDPSAPNPWHTLGQLLYFDRQFSAAIEAYDSARARTSEGPHVELLINRATVLAQLGRTRAAVEGYEAAFAADSALLRHPYVNHEYGAALVRLGRAADARAAYAARLAGTPEDRAGAYRSLALLEAHRGRFARAREFLDQAVTGSTAVPDTLGAAIAHLLRAETAMTQGDTARALPDLAAVERYGGARPLPYEIVSHAVKLLARAGATPRASALLARLESQTRAISGTARARLLVARGEVLLARGRIAEGRGAAEQALALAPTREAKESAAFAAAAAGDFVQAAGRYDSLAADRGMDWDGHVVIELGAYLAARAWERAGDAERARRGYEGFLAAWSGEAFDSGLPAVVDARRRIGVLTRAAGG